MSAVLMSAPARGVTVRIDAIEIPSTTRPYNATAVVDLSRSIAAIGLQSAPTVVEREGRFVLIAGRHRIEALGCSASKACWSGWSISTTSRPGCGRSARTCIGPS